MLMKIAFTIFCSLVKLRLCKFILDLVGFDSLFHYITRVLFLNLDFDGSCKIL